MLVEVCKCLKIMNTLRSRQASFPLSYFQYKELTPTALLDKLLQRRQHSLAHGICVYLGLNSNAVLLHWACAKAARGIDDECTCESILARTEESKGIPYATIANTALLHGRPRLATRLLNYETRAGEQVPLLLALSENELALTKAVESGDTDLVYLTILQLNKKLSLGDFFQIIREKQVACNLLIQYYKSHDKELLKDLYYQNDQKMELTFLRLQELSHHASTENYQANVTAVIKQLNEARDALFYKRALEGQLQLRKVQKKLDSASNELVGLPLAETVFRLLLQGEEAKASKLKSTFKMTNKKFWWLKIRSLGAKFYWTELEKFSLAKKSPIGYEPFAEECMARGAFEEAVKYILKCPVSTQVTFYCNLGRFDEAIECAVRNKSIRDLELVEEVARRNPHVLEKVEKAKVSLSR